MRSRWTRIAALLSTAITVAVVSTTTGNAATITGHDRQTPMFQSWVDAAAPLVPLPNVPIEVIQERCPPEIAHDAYWCMDPKSIPTRVWTGTNSAYLWGPADLYSERDRLTTRLTFLHEIGHVFDLAAPGPKGYRRAFVRAMGTRWSGWWWPRYEQFAMAYAFCAMYPHYDDAAFARTVWWGYNYSPTREQYERVCFAIRHAPQYNRRGRLKRDSRFPGRVPHRPDQSIASTSSCRSSPPCLPPSGGRVVGSVGSTRCQIACIALTLVVGRA